jgi:hypothetical protein
MAISRSHAVRRWGSATPRGGPLAQAARPVCGPARRAPYLPAAQPTTTAAGPLPTCSDGDVRPLHLISGPSAWVAADYQHNSQEWIYAFSEQDLQEIEAACAHVEQLGLEIQVRQLCLPLPLMLLLLLPLLLMPRLMPLMPLPLLRCHCRRRCPRAPAPAPPRPRHRTSPGSTSSCRGWAPGWSRCSARWWRGVASRCSGACRWSVTAGGALRWPTGAWAPGGAGASARTSRAT